MTSTTPDAVPGSAGDGQLAALFAVEPVRSALVALHNWHDEIAGLPLRISEPSIGAMRMEWHLNAVDDAYAAPPVVRRNPLVEGVAALRALPGNSGAFGLRTVVTSHGTGFEGERFGDLGELMDFGGAGWGRIMFVAARLLDPEFQRPECLNSAADAWGLTEMIRSFPWRAGRGLAIIPDDIMAQHGLTPPRLASGREPELARAALKPVIALARSKLDAARKDLRELPPALFPAWGPVALADGYLKQAEKAVDPYRTTITLSPLTKRFLLMKASLTGRP